MNRREFLMQAQTYNEAKHNIAGYYASEKMDGIRCFWDGGLSRDIPTTSIPWANVTNPKTGQPKTRIKPIASGLWSRHGNPIMAPDWFLNSMPCCPLDGELWAGRGGFQTVTSTARKNKPVTALTLAKWEEEWKQIRYGIFGSPNIWDVMQSGEIRTTQFVKTIHKEEIERWIRNRDRDILLNFRFMEERSSFAAELANLSEWIDITADTYFLVLQTKLPNDEYTAKAAVEAAKREVIESGGEGLFLRDCFSCWEPRRVHTCLKIKGLLDAEGTVVGFTSGRETEKGSKLLGMIGALVLDFNGKRLELSGLTNEEREFSSPVYTQFAKDFPGQDMPEDMDGKHFKVGDRVTFTYRELTNDGVPKEARYLRKRN